MRKNLGMYFLTGCQKSKFFIIDSDTRIGEDQETPFSCLPSTLRQERSSPLSAIRRNQTLHIVNLMMF